MSSHLLMCKFTLALMDVESSKVNHTLNRKEQDKLYK